MPRARTAVVGFGSTSPPRVRAETTEHGDRAASGRGMVDGAAGSSRGRTAVPWSDTGPALDVSLDPARQTHTPKRNVGCVPAEQRCPHGARTARARPRDLPGRCPDDLSATQGLGTPGRARPGVPSPWVAERSSGHRPGRSRGRARAVRAPCGQRYSAGTHPTFRLGVCVWRAGSSETSRAGPVSDHRMAVRPRDDTAAPPTMPRPDAARSPCSVVSARTRGGDVDPNPTTAVRARGLTKVYGSGPSAVRCRRPWSGLGRGRLWWGSGPHLLLGFAPRLRSTATARRLAVAWSAGPPGHPVVGQPSRGRTPVRPSTFRSIRRARRTHPSETWGAYPRSSAVHMVHGPHGPDRGICQDGVPMTSRLPKDWAPPAARGRGCPVLG